LMSYSFYRFGLFLARSVHTSFKYKQFQNKQKDKNSERSFKSSIYGLKTLK
jgi:hypothetical protein